MYSVILATMLTVGGGTSVGFHHHHRCHGCSGCSGYAFSCSGCYGGCYGCYGGYSYGCSCYGCSGCSCFGSCSGAIISSSCYGCCGGFVIRSSCYGCCGGVIISSGCTGCYGGAVISSSHVNSPAVPSTSNAAPAKSTTPTATTAQITVRVPGAARLWVDDVSCPIPTGERSFATPQLTPGQKYMYTMKVEVQRDGKAASENRRVTFTAGQQVVVDFTAASNLTAQR